MQTQTQKEQLLWWISAQLYAARQEQVYLTNQSVISKMPIDSNRMAFLDGVASTYNHMLSVVGNKEYLIPNSQVADCE